MKPEEQNAAIAEWMGWKRADGMNPWTDEMCHWLRPDNVGVKTCPNYLNDLNAMHEVEKKLSNKEQHQMNELLYCDIVPQGIRIWHATAAQRAEALLKTINKWKDTP